MGDARTVVVTGANRGIGAAIAEELRRGGHRVIGTSRDGKDGFEPVDVTRQATIEALASTLRRRELGGIDALVNNAGVSLDGFNADVARRTLDTNFYGAMRMTDALLPLLRPGGRVVMVSSGLGELSSVGPELRPRFLDPALTRDELVELVESFVRHVVEGDHERHGWPSSAYRVSKVGLNALVRVLARDLADDPRRIRVNATCPGWVRTRMGTAAAPRSPEEGADTPVWLAVAPEADTTGGLFRDRRRIPW